MDFSEKDYMDLYNILAFFCAMLNIFTRQQTKVVTSNYSMRAQSMV
jgi:hypothetical protein